MAVFYVIPLFIGLRSAISAILVIPWPALPLSSSCSLPLCLSYSHCYISSWAWLSFWHRHSIDAPLSSLNRLMASSSFLPSQSSPSLNHPFIYPFLPSPSRLLSPYPVQAWGQWGQFSCLAKSQNSFVCIYMWVCVRKREREREYVSQQPHTSHVVGDLLTYLYSSPLLFPLPAIIQCDKEIWLTPVLNSYACACTHTYMHPSLT